MNRCCTCSRSFQTQKTLSFSGHTNIHQQKKKVRFGCCRISRKPRFFTVKTIVSGRWSIKAGHSNTTNTTSAPWVWCPKLWGEALTLCAGGREDCPDALVQYNFSSDHLMWRWHISPTATIDNWPLNFTFECYHRIRSDELNFTKFDVLDKMSWISPVTLDVLKHFVTVEATLPCISTRWSDGHRGSAGFGRDEARWKVKGWNHGGFVRRYG